MPEMVVPRPIQAKQGHLTLIDPINQLYQKVTKFCEKMCQKWTFKEVKSVFGKIDIPRCQAIYEVKFEIFGVIFWC